MAKIALIVISILIGLIVWKVEKDITSGVIMGCLALILFNIVDWALKYP